MRNILNIILIKEKFFNHYFSFDYDYNSQYHIESI